MKTNYTIIIRGVRLDGSIPLTPMGEKVPDILVHLNVHESIMEERVVKLASDFKAYMPNLLVQVAAHVSDDKTGEFQLKFSAIR